VVGWCCGVWFWRSWFIPKDQFLRLLCFHLPKVCFQRLLGKDFYIGRKQGKHLICWQFFLCCDASFKCMGLESTSMSLYLTSLGCQKEVSTTKQKQRVSLSVPDQSRPVLKWVCRSYTRRVVIQLVEDKTSMVVFSLAMPFHGGSSHQCNIGSGPRIVMAFSECQLLRNFSWTPDEFMQHSIGWWDFSSNPLPERGVLCSTLVIDFLAY
jgi:hypothetical protein